jgi:hypothetical protein
MLSSGTQSTSRQRTATEVFYDHLEKRKKGLVEEDIAKAILEQTGAEDVARNGPAIKFCLRQLHLQ